LAIQINQFSGAPIYTLGRVFNSLQIFVSCIQTSDVMRTLFLLPIMLLTTALAMAQPTDPILRVENEMHTAITRRVSVDKAGKYILTASEDKTARLWDAATGQLLKIYRIPINKDNDGKIFACALFPDASKAVVGGWTGYDWDEKECVYVIDVQTGEIVKKLSDFSDVINDIEMSPDGTMFACGAADGSVRVYNSRTLERCAMMARSVCMMVNYLTC
jgi:WD40 repeat protein